MKIFIDTGIFITLFIPSEKYHQAVLEKYRYYQSQKVRFVTSTYILAELYTRLIYDFGKVVTEKAIEEVGKTIDQRALALIDIDETAFHKATEVLIKFAEHKLSFADATTYVLYKELSLDEIFTLDSDFKKIRLRTSF